MGRWLEVRACHGITGLSPVFSTLEGNRLTEAYVRALLPRLARKAGVEKRVHAHGVIHRLLRSNWHQGSPKTPLGNGA